ncbi:hypothetical protein PVAP13_9NG609114 [Panicum virgatum]|uniref:Uncharacterized protein n=1 Tax=Panicum virgatum TaxID=38727 RepID=A0A8T0MW39_PANVG|nr:hypothetical protein PVAP13_9NG609114 [Panicum virgatum]
MPPRATGPRLDGHPPGPGPRIRRRHLSRRGCRPPRASASASASARPQANKGVDQAPPQRPQGNRQQRAGAERTSCRALPRTEKRTRRLPTASACSLSGRTSHLLSCLPLAPVVAPGDLGKENDRRNGARRKVACLYLAPFTLNQEDKGKVLFCPSMWPQT